MDENDRSAPATKGDLADLRAELKGDVAALTGSIASVLEAVHYTETKLLTAFYSYAKSNDRRVLETEGNESALRGRMAVLESRMTDVEERLNRPPQQ